jgi:hypothetical protein
VLKSFKATSIEPIDLEPILKRFNYKVKHKGKASAQPLALNVGN